MENNDEIKIEDGKDVNKKLPVSIRLLKKVGVEEKYANSVLIVIAVVLYAVLAYLLYTQF